MNNNNYAVIIAGGVGSRFWPKSQLNRPKQFLDILNVGETLIQQTFSRLKKVCLQENILVVTNRNYRSLCLEQLPELLEENILCEPAMRNTAACIAYAAFKIHAMHENANMLISPSDHIILKEDEFIRLARQSFEIVAKHQILLTFGINASRPDTGYGYIQFTEDNLVDYKMVKKVKTFTEKPDQNLAINFLNSGDFLWNSGIFFWSAKTIRLSYRKYCRDIYDIFEEGKQFYNTNKEIEFINRVFPGCKNISIDYALIEKADNVYVYPANFGWSDLGTWRSLYEMLDIDENKNSIQGKKVIVNASTDNIINVPDDKVVLVQGMSGYIVVEDSGCLLICKKEDEQKIKQLISKLSNN